MKKIICEMCEGTEFKKENGEFICCGCNTHYSVEEAKGMMIEVEDEGSSSSYVDPELENLYTLARRAKETDNNENATKYYEMIMVKDPDSWEANFYSVYFKAMSCKIAEIAQAATSVKNCIFSTMQLIAKVADESERKNALAEMKERSFYISNMLATAAKNHYDGIDASIRNNYTMELVTNQIAAYQIESEYCDKLCNVFSDDTSVMGDFGITVLKERISKGIREEIAKKYYSIINKYDADYVLPPKKEKPVINNTPQPTTSGGCYVATAVYGSYDCPEVWTLRRFRDNTLAESIFGRAFIHTYYAISPTLVKWFGETQWFKNLFKGRLDKMVKSLNEKGFEDTPYEDKNWK